MHHANRLVQICVAIIAYPSFAIASCEEPDTQFEMNMCAHEEFKQHDEALNLAYQKYRAGLPDSQKKLLKDAQVFWIKFRDASCKFEASAVEGGSMQPMAYSMCLTDYTIMRLERIKALSECKLMPNPGKDCAS